jgi:hypothetical protein
MGRGQFLVLSHEERIVSNEVSPATFKGGWLKVAHGRS